MNISMIEQKYQQLCNTHSDIHEHLPTLKKYAEGKEVVELGVRAIVSTWALLAGKPKSLLSIDIKYPSEYGGDLIETELAAAEANIFFIFKKEDSLTVNLPEHDVLFIDTNHTYDQLSQELKRHSPKTREYILMHDTNQEEFPDMRRAINEFLDSNKEWEIKEQFENCHGLTALQRV
jgi:hypothetical protein